MYEFETIKFNYILNLFDNVRKALGAVDSFLPLWQVLRFTFKSWFGSAFAMYNPIQESFFFRLLFAITRYAGSWFCEQDTAMTITI